MQRQRAQADRLQDRVALFGQSRHQQVVARLHAPDRVHAAEPVRSDEPFEAPLVAQYGREQVGAFRGVGAVEFVVRGHDRPRLRLLYDDFERTEVHLAQCAGRDDRIVVETVGLLVVRDEVFYRGAYALLLDAVYDRCGNFSCQQRVFREVFEIAAVQRVALQVHAGAEQYVRTVFVHLFPHRVAYAADKDRIPCRGQQRADRKLRGVKGLCGTVACGRNADPRRAVREDDRRHAETLDREGGPGGARHQFAGLADDRGFEVCRAGARAHEQVDLLLDGHRVDNLPDRVFSQLWEFFRRFPAGSGAILSGRRRLLLSGSILLPCWVRSPERPGNGGRQRQYQCAMHPCVSSHIQSKR